MSHKRYISFYLSVAILLHSQSVDSRKEKDEILTDLNLENSTEFKDLPVSLSILRSNTILFLRFYPSAIPLKE